MTKKRSHSERSRRTAVFFNLLNKCELQNIVISSVSWQTKQKATKSKACPEYSEGKDDEGKNDEEIAAIYKKPIPTSVILIPIIIGRFSKLKT